ncbi:MAG: DUF2065 domain-containing protein [Magnetococcales bacterium]|nr:DUF2065 domain-containing protein [Magnetococcales bacterium]
MNDFLTALGLVLILEGVPYFLAPTKMRAWVVQIVKLPNTALRKTGLTLMILGLLMVYMVRS